MKKVLWIAPTLNHYKSRFLSRLSYNSNLKITVLAGTENKSLGHSTDSNIVNFKRINIKASKQKFHLSLEVYIRLYQLIVKKKFKVVLMPAEKKHFPIIFFLFVLKYIFKYTLLSYNHPTAFSLNKNHKFIDFAITKLIFLFYDRIVFYTEEGRNTAISRKLVPSNKAFFANNTLDTSSVWEHYSFEVNKNPCKTILFIGRLLPNKRLDLLFEYYRELKKKIPELKLIIIGNGPEFEYVKNLADSDADILWRGAVIDEKKIAEDMKRSHIVFIPGHTGLSIVHAFCYGKPFITLASYKNHPPEIDYLRDGVNGLFLNGNKAENCIKIANLLQDENKYFQYSNAAFNEAKRVSIENWCYKMNQALDY